MINSNQHTQTMVGIVFLSRDVAHKEHFKTRSYAAHVALGDFYDSIIPLVDSFVEAYQGAFLTKLTNIPYLTPDKGEDVAETLTGHMETLMTTRYKAVDKECTSIQNIIDEIISEYQSLLYKLTFLS